MEVCATSNLITGSVKTAATHPFEKFVDIMQYRAAMHKHGKAPLPRSSFACARYTAAHTRKAPLHHAARTSLTTHTPAAPACVIQQTRPRDRVRRSQAIVAIL